PTRSTLFPYTTLFRSRRADGPDLAHLLCRAVRGGDRLRIWTAKPSVERRVADRRLQCSQHRHDRPLPARLRRGPRAAELSCSERSEEHTSELQSPCNL